MSPSTDALNRIRTARKLLGSAAAPVGRRHWRSLPAPRPAVQGQEPSALRSDRFLLRPLRASDRGEFIRIASLSRAHLARFCPLYLLGETDAMLFERHLALTDAGERTGRAWRRMIVLPDGRLAGAVNINNLLRGLEHDGEINWWVSADQIGAGLATEAVQLAAGFALDDLPHGLGLTVLRALITPDNEPSRRLAAAAGFRRLGFSPPIELNLAGRWTSHDTFVRYAPVGAAGGSPGRAGAKQTTRVAGSGLASILATEATTLLRVRSADRGDARPHQAPALAPA